MTDKLLALAARVEGAVGADRELDEAIWLAVTTGSRAFDTVIPANEKRRGWTIREQREASGKMIVVSAYTASLDAAMTLIPEGTRWLARGPTEGALIDPRMCFCRLESADYNAVTYGKGCDWITDVMSGHAVQGVAATPALALAAAALRARAES